MFVGRQSTNVFVNALLHTETHRSFSNCVVTRLQHDFTRFLPSQQRLRQTHRYILDKVAQEGAHKCTVTHSMFIRQHSLMTHPSPFHFHDRYGKPSAAP